MKPETSLSLDFSASARFPCQLVVTFSEIADLRAEVDDLFP